ncbi:MAG: hypothetical protein LAQ69_11170 [Acidobacteriia bacterium]|nr:hypothetical protein [Terriglobia bacterium]
MSHEKTAIPDDLLQLSQQFEAWRGAHPPRARLPETMWAAATSMARQHGVCPTAKTLRLDFTRLKQRLTEATPARSAPAQFLELLASPAPPPAECVVEVESSRGRMRVAIKGVTPDWATLLRAFRETAG